MNKKEFPKNTRIAVAVGISLIIAYGLLKILIHKRINDAAEYLQEYMKSHPELANQTTYEPVDDFRH